jgi:hypothetical protein
MIKTMAANSRSNERFAIVLGLGKRTSNPIKVGNCDISLCGIAVPSVHRQQLAVNTIKNIGELPVGTSNIIVLCPILSWQRKIQSS